MQAAHEAAGRDEARARRDAHDGRVGGEDGPLLSRAAAGARGQDGGGPVGARREAEGRICAEAKLSWNPFARSNGPKLRARLGRRVAARNAAQRVPLGRHWLRALARRTAA